MYLIVFVTLVIAILGTYTQVLSVQTARIISSQTNIAQTMIAWHTAAISMAESILDTQTYNLQTNALGQYNSSLQTNGCILSNDPIPGASILPCPSPMNGSQSQTTGLDSAGTISGGISVGSSSPSYTVGRIWNSRGSQLNECVHLPNTSCTSTDVNFGCISCTTTFDIKDYEFYSILYRTASTGNASGTDVVITYAAAPAGNKYITLASGKQLSLTPANLIQQFRNIGNVTFSYGTVTNNTITAGAAQYPIPSNANVPNGAVVLVGFPAGNGAPATANPCTTPISLGTSQINSGGSITGYSSAAPAGLCQSQQSICKNGFLVPPIGSYTNQYCTSGCALPWNSSSYIAVNTQVTGYSNAATPTPAPNPTAGTTCSSISNTLTCINASGNTSAGSFTMPPGITGPGVYTIGTCSNGCATAWGNLYNGQNTISGAPIIGYSSAAPLPPTTCSSSQQALTCSGGNNTTGMGSMTPAGYNNLTCNNGCTGTPWGNVVNGYSNTAYSSINPASTCAAASQTRTCSGGNNTTGLGTMSGTFTATSCNGGCTSTPWGPVSNGFSGTAYASATPAGPCSSQTRTCTNGSFSGSFTSLSCTNGCAGTPWGNLVNGQSVTAYAASSVTCSSCSAQTRTCSNGTFTGSWVNGSCSSHGGPLGHFGACGGNNANCASCSCGNYGKSGWLCN
jgi:hypothetical protein